MILTKKEAVLSQIFELSPIDRADIAEKILSSFELSQRNEIDEEWSIEAESRIDGYLSGKIKTKSMEDIFKNINGDTVI